MVAHHIVEQFRLQACDNLGSIPGTARETSHFFLALSLTSTTKKFDLPCSPEKDTR